MNRKIWFLIAYANTIGIFLLSTFLAIPIQVEGVEGLDKWEHAFAYLVLTGSYLIAFRQNGQLKQHTPWIIFLLCGTYGMLLEFIQYLFFAYRYFEWYDALANLTGSVLGLMVFKLFVRK